MRANASWGGEEQEEEPQSIQDAEDGPNHPGSGTGARPGSKEAFQKHERILHVRNVVLPSGN